MANIITACRILCCIALLFCPTLSTKFIIFYLIAGFTDMLDGTVARKTNTVSEFGSKLDTFADFVFAAVCLIKLLPILNLPAWLWLWIGAIAVIKVITMVVGFITWKTFVAEHTILNKITGLLLFIFPITMPLIASQYSAIALCLIATCAAIQEGYIVWNRKFHPHPISDTLHP